MHHNAIIHPCILTCCEGYNPIIFGNSYTGIEMGSAGELVNIMLPATPHMVEVGKYIWEINVRYICRKNLEYIVRIYGTKVDVPVVKEKVTIKKKA